MGKGDDFWRWYDKVSAEFLRRFSRVIVQLAGLVTVGMAIYYGLSKIPNDSVVAFRVLSVIFVLLYVLFVVFSLSCLLTKFQERKVLPPLEGGIDGNPDAPGLYKSLWRIESAIGIQSFDIKDRYKYWSFIHYILAILMFLNATYCLSRSNFAFSKDFVQIDSLNNAYYTIDLLHKGIIISEAFAHFEKKLAVDLPHTFKAVDFESIYFFSFKILSAVLLISVLTMLFEPVFSRARRKRAGARRT